VHFNSVCAKNHDQATDATPILYLYVKRKEMKENREAGDVVARNATSHVTQRGRSRSKESP